MKMRMHRASSFRSGAFQPAGAAPSAGAAAPAAADSAALEVHSHDSRP